MHKKSILEKTKTLLEAIKFEHTIFALPFAYLGMIFAARGLPTIAQFIWITIAMVAARSLAMAANRLIDRHIDAQNPRTLDRALPRGLLSPRDMTIFCLISFGLLLFASWQLNTLCFALSPVAAIIVVGYSYTKRFTWLCHYILGIADGLAPIGGWLAVTGELSWPPFVLGFIIASWIGGFDLIFSCMDAEFDRKTGLKSIPAQFGIAKALQISTLSHLITVGLLIYLGLLLKLGPLYYTGVFLATCLLIYEHLVVKPNDKSRLTFAFFKLLHFLNLSNQRLRLGDSKN